MDDGRSKRYIRAVRQNAGGAAGAAVAGPPANLSPTSQFAENSGEDHIP